MFPHEDPIGHRIQCGLDSMNFMTIVGVVGDIRDEPGTAARAELYMPIAQHPGRGAQVDRCAHQRSRRQRSSRRSTPANPACRSGSGDEVHDARAASRPTRSPRRASATWWSRRSRGSRCCWRWLASTDCSRISLRSGCRSSASGWRLALEPAEVMGLVLGRAASSRGGLADRRRPVARRQPRADDRWCSGPRRWTR